MDGVTELLARTTHKDSTSIRCKLCADNAFESVLKLRKTFDLEGQPLRQMAQSLVGIHDRRVIVVDIAARNFLVATDRAIKFSDFTGSSLIELDNDMQTADDNGYSIYTDIGQLGAVTYEVTTGKECHFALCKGLLQGPATALYPRRESLPSTDGIWLGPIIEKCWRKGAFCSSRGPSAVLYSATPNLG